MSYLKTQLKPIDTNSYPIDKTNDDSFNQFLNLDQINVINEPSNEANSNFIENLIPQYNVNSNHNPHKVINGKLNELLKIISDDVSLSKDRLYALNSARVALIEKRIDSIARKIALIKGERYHSTVKLEEVIRNSFKSTKRNHPIQQAWLAFLAEVSLYNMFEIFILKSLDFYGIRFFEEDDIKKLNFSIHNFLTLNAAGFNHDKHCWNFVRNNIYSWYTPSSQTVEQIQNILSDIDNESPLSWSDIDLLNWIKNASDDQHLSHLQFFQGYESSIKILDLIENGFKIPFSHSFKNQNIFSKVFIPALGKSGLALGLLDIFLKRLKGNLTSAEEEQTLEAQQIQNALWFCESEALELYWTEVMCLLKVVKLASSDRAIQNYEQSNFRIPQIIHSVHALGLELHDIDELQFKTNETYKVHQGSAAKIQQLEMFDLSIVADCPERVKSQAWMQALAEQIPYWKNYIGTHTNINWGETHLLLSISKLKDNGRCVYMSTKPLSDIKDSEKLRKSILSQCILETYFECNQNSDSNFQYIYIFKKCSNKELRDSNRTLIGKSDHFNVTDISKFEKSYIIHADLVENGFNQLHSVQENSILKHFETHFPKLFQIANVKIVTQKDQNKLNTENEILNLYTDTKVNKIFVQNNQNCISFSYIKNENTEFEMTLHNPEDLKWLLAYLNSKLIQKWIMATIAMNPNKTIRIQDVKNIPVLDAKIVQDETIGRYAEMIATIQNFDRNINNDHFLKILNHKDMNHEDLCALYFAMSKQIHSLDVLIDRYKPFFIDQSILNDFTSPRLKPSAIAHFYPDRLLVELKKSNEVKIQYKTTKDCSIPYELWFIQDVALQNEGKHSSLIINTKMNTQIVLLVHNGVAEYIFNQMESLIDYSWGELLHLIQVPNDISLFVTQTQEIVHIISRTYENSKILRNQLDTVLEKIYLQ